MGTVIILSSRFTGGAGVGIAVNRQYRQENGELLAKVSVTLASEKVLNPVHESWDREDYEN